MMNRDREHWLALTAASRLLLMGAGSDTVKNLVKTEVPSAIEADILEVTALIERLGLETEQMAKRYAGSK